MFRFAITIVLAVPITVLSNNRQSGQMENPHYNWRNCGRCGERPIAPRLLIIILDLTIMLLVFCDDRSQKQRTFGEEKFVYFLCVSLLECFLNSSVLLYSVFNIVYVYLQQLLGAPCYPVIVFTSNLTPQLLLEYLYLVAGLVQLVRSSTGEKYLIARVGATCRASYVALTVNM